MPVMPRCWNRSLDRGLEDGEAVEFLLLQEFQHLGVSALVRRPEARQAAEHRGVAPTTETRRTCAPSVSFSEKPATPFLSGSWVEGQRLAISLRG